MTAAWYCLSGLFTALEEVEPNLAAKVSLLVAALGPLTEQAFAGESPGDYRIRILESLKHSHAILFQAAS